MDTRKPKNPFIKYLKIAAAVAVIFFSAKLAVEHFVHPGPEEMARRASHTVSAKKKTPRPAPRTAPVPVTAKGETPAGAGSPRMAIILDDWGNNYAVIDYALAVGRPLTLSILPNLPNSAKIAEKAHSEGLGVMLHMPMQPISKKQPLEPHTILTTTPDADIRQYLSDALASVPYVEGVNNHQGSAATSDARVMTTVLGEIKKRGLFFIDSAVIATIKSPAIAAKIGLRYDKRDVFIDNVLKGDAIKAELRRAIRLAVNRGDVIVIGHDHKQTLIAIKEMLPEIDAAGVRLVTADELVRT